MSQPVLVCPELFRFEGDVPQLLGSECSDCGETYFPAATGCTRCLSPHMKLRELGRRGTLWSWTIQAFLPKSPYDSGETPDTLNTFQGLSNGVQEGLATGPVPGGYTPRLQQGANPKRDVYGSPLDDRPRSV